MIQRCTNPKNNGYAGYGGIGITVCEQWRTSFKAFIDYVKPRPGPDWQLGRIDNHRGYEPGNVKWEPVAENARNKRNNVYVDALDVRNLLTVIEQGELRGERMVTTDAIEFLRP